MTPRISDMPPDTKISRHYTVNDWIGLSQLLMLNSTDSSAWEKAFDIFETRIWTRFLDPIKKIYAGNELFGEGFSATALQCILIEFLEAFYQGKIYRSPYAKEQIFRLTKKIGKTQREIQDHCQPNEYTSSAKLFHDFLTCHEPFKKNFTSSSLVSDFYREIRCGLLHEAATKGKAKIRAHKYEAPECLVERLNDGSLILYRNSFIQGIESYIKEYKKKFLHSPLIQGNFFRKMDDICQIKRLYYFAYGSNMSTSRLIKRISFVHSAIPGHIENHRFKYNKKSKDGSGKANIEVVKGEKTYGICYEIDQAGFDELKNKFEKGYNIKEVCVTIKCNQDNFLIAKTFISNSITDAQPMHNYIGQVVSGAREHGIPEEYIVENLCPLSGKKTKLH